VAAELRTVLDESVSYWKRRKTESVRLATVEFGLLGIKGTWVADRAQQKAAWELHVELATRIAVQSLPSDRGLVREALNSLYTLFGETRRILKEYGPEVAVPQGDDAVSFAQIAVTVLNHTIRPYTEKWHPQLMAHEALRSPQTPPSTHELEWEHHDTARAELNELQLRLSAYATLLARAAGIPPLHLAP